MLHYNGQLMVRVAGRSYESLVDGPDPLLIRGYEIEPLFKCYQKTSAFSPTIAQDNWFLAAPSQFAVGPPQPPADGSPWDVAHQVAKDAEYAFYVEPDFIRIRQSPYPEPPTQGPNPIWPPSGPVTPGWHLYDSFTGALSAAVKGTGVKIAHVDTGYSDHYSKPLKLQPDLGWNFYERNSDSMDPGTNFGWPPPTPGHGTATLALLAGNKLDMLAGIGLMTISA